MRYSNSSSVISASRIGSQAQFGLDDAYLEDLKAEIIEARQLAVDQDGTMLVWCGTS